MINWKIPFIAVSVSIIVYVHTDIAGYTSVRCTGVDFGSLVSCRRWILYISNMHYCSVKNCKSNNLHRNVILHVVKEECTIVN